MRILHLIPGLAWDCGASRQLCNISDELARQGHEVHVAYWSGRIPAGMEFTGVQLHHIASNGAHDPLLLWRSVRLLRQLKPDVVQTWFLQVDVLGGLASRFSGTAWVIREPGSGAAYKGWKNRLRLWLARYASAIVVNSQTGRAYWLNNANIKDCRIIRNGMRIEEHSQAPNDAAIGDSRTRTLLYVGRLEEVKNLPTMLVALSKVIRSATYPITMIIAGEGSERSRLEKLAAEIGIGDRVRFTGAIEHTQVIELMRRADMLLLVSRHEGFPNVVLEAMACACPVVVSDIPAHREFLDTNAALFVKPDDATEMSKAISECLDNEIQTRIRAGNAQVIAKQWTIEKTTREYEKLYGEVLGPGYGGSKGNA
jgi:glycosyltransferase involved in cell wall biosynthesis